MHSRGLVVQNIIDIFQQHPFLHQQTHNYMLRPITRIQILKHTLHVLNFLILLWVPAIISHQIKQYTSCKKNRFICIPWPVLTLASDSLKTVKVRHVFHIWRHQEKVQGGKNGSDSVTMAIAAACYFPQRCNTTPLRLPDDLDSVEWIAG